MCNSIHSFNRLIKAADMYPHFMWVKRYINTFNDTSTNFTFFFLSDDKGMLHLRKTFDYGKSFHTIATRVYSFVLGGRFVFASIMTGTVRLCVCVRAPLYLYSLRAECVCFVNRHCIFAVCI